MAGVTPELVQRLGAALAPLKIRVRGVAPCAGRYPRAHVHFVSAVDPRGEALDLVLKLHRTADGLRRDEAGIELGRRAGFRTPVVMSSGRIEGAPVGEFYIVMTRLDGELLECASQDSFQQAMERVPELLARLHAVVPAEIDFDASARSLTPNELWELLEASREFLRGRSGEGAVDWMCEVVEALGEYWADSEAGFTTHPRSFVHGDLHESNFLVAEDTPPGLIDWDGCGAGDAAAELAYFLVRTLQLRAPGQAQGIHERIVERHLEGSGDADLPARLAYYVPASLIHAISHSAACARPDLAGWWTERLRDEVVRLGGA